MQKVTLQVYDSEELAKTFQSNNSEANKKHKVEEVLDEVLLKLVDDRLDFYNKVNKDNVRKLLVEQLFSDYKDKMKGA